MTRAVWDRLLSEARAAHEASPSLQNFCPFPADIQAQDVEAFHIPAAEHLYGEMALASRDHAALRDAFVAAGPHAKWRETYKDTHIGQDFLDRFCCYCLIGTGGAFHSDQMAAWVVYMPRGLHYPFHHHPGEEMYAVIAGEAEFFRDGEAPECLSEGATSEHSANQPHAMTTHNSPVMAYVVWRNGFATPPVLTVKAEVRA